MDGPGCESLEVLGAGCGDWDMETGIWGSESGPGTVGAVRQAALRTESQENSAAFRYCLDMPAAVWTARHNETCGRRRM